MRDIKFRVWDKMEKRFIYPDKGYQGHYILSLGGEFYNLQNGSGGDEYIVQQYTGLKDKNGKDIYEGDFIKTSKPLFKDDIHEYTAGQIKFFTSSWKVCQKRVGATPLGEYTCCDGDHDEYTLEVVGNIFENPELL